MADPSLVNYVNQLLQSGYDLNTIRNQLLAAGYSPQVVEEAVSAAYRAPAQPSALPSGIPAIFRSKKFLFIAGGVLAAIIISFAVLMLASGPSANPISLSLSSVSTEVIAGGSLNFVQYIENIGRSGPVSLSYTVIDSRGTTVTSDTKRGDASVFSPSSSISIPAGTQPGKYTLLAKADYSGQSAESSLSFAVKAAEETPEAGLPGEEAGEGAGELTPGEGGIPGGAATPQEPTTTQTPGGEAGLDPSGDEDYDGIINLYDYYKGDRDNDGTPDQVDTDNDNDGVPDESDDYPFDFDNDGILDKDDDEAGRSYRIPSEQGAEKICSDDYGCNDFEICTSDSCEGGKCANIPITPCCGNRRCETGESPLNCPSDCVSAASATATRPKNQETIELAAETAKTNTDKAVKTCLGIEEPSDSDVCISTVAKASETPTVCSQVQDQRKRDICYMFFAMKHEDFSVCPMISDRNLKNSCYAMKSIKAIQTA